MSLVFIIFSRKFTQIAQNSDRPFKASSAYENIVSSINSAKDAGIEALEAAKQANLTSLGDPFYGNATNSLLLKSKLAKRKSDKLLRDAQTEKARLESSLLH